MRFCIVILSIIFCSAGLSAQEYSADWGPAYKLPNNSYLHQIIMNKDGSFLTSRVKMAGSFSTSKLYLERYGPDLQLQKNVELKLKTSGKTRTYVDLLKLKGGNFFLLSSFFNKGHKKNYLFAQSLDPNKLLPNPKLNMIAEIPSFNMYEEGFFSLHASEDSSRLLINAQIPEKKKDPEAFSFYVYDYQFNLQWKKIITLPYPSEDFLVEEFKVDPSGNVYVLGRMGQKIAKNPGRSGQFIILSYRDNGQTVEEYPVRLEDKSIVDLTFKINRDGNLICAGFYAYIGSNSIRGTYYKHIDINSKEVLLEGYTDFDLGFITEQLPDRQRSRAEEAERQGQLDQIPGLFEYNLRDIILRSDGGAVLIAEQRYIDERTYFNNPGWNSPWAFRNPWGPWGGWGGWGWNNWNNQREVDYHFNYNDIIIVNIRPDGSIEWSSRIPKRQETVNDGGFYSSFTNAISARSLVFVYNDHPANLSPNSNTLTTFTGRRGMPVVAEVSRDGDIMRFEVDGQNQAVVLPRPKLSKQISSRELLLYGENNREFQFGILSL